LPRRHRPCSAGHPSAPPRPERVRRAGAPAGPGLRAEDRHRGGPPPLDDSARSAGEREDHAGAPAGLDLGGRVRGGERGSGRAGPDEVGRLLDRALAAGECGQHEVAAEALEFLSQRAGGDARVALNALELACSATPEGQAVSLAQAEDALQQRALLYDRQADRHYDTISAWIKATRGSDPDASLYYLAVMLEGGEDPR